MCLSAHHVVSWRLKEPKIILYAFLILTSDWNAILPDTCMAKFLPLSGLCSKVTLPMKPRLISHLNLQPMLFLPGTTSLYLLYFLHIARIEPPCSLLIYYIYSLLSVLCQDVKASGGQQLLSLLFTDIHILSTWNSALHMDGSQ